MQTILRRGLVSGNNEEKNLGWLLEGNSSGIKEGGAFGVVYIPFRLAGCVVLKYRHRGVGVENGRRQERQKGSVCPRRGVITCAILLVVGKSTDDMKYLQPRRKEKYSG